MTCWLVVGAGLVALVVVVVEDGLRSMISGLLDSPASYHHHPVMTDAAGWMREDHGYRE